MIWLWYICKRTCFIRMYMKLKDKKIGMFRVSMKIGDNAYKMNFPADMNISSTYNVADIFKYYMQDEFSLSTTNTGSNFFQVVENDVGQSYYK